MFPYWTYFDTLEARLAFRIGDMIGVTADDGKALYQVTNDNPTGFNGIMLHKIASVEAFS